MTLTVNDDEPTAMCLLERDLDATLAAVEGMGLPVAVSAAVAFEGEHASCKPLPLEVSSSRYEPRRRACQRGDQRPRSSCRADHPRSGFRPSSRTCTTRHS